MVSPGNEDGVGARLSDCGGGQELTPPFNGDAVLDLKVKEVVR